MLEDTKKALQDKNINMTITKDAKLLLLNINLFLINHQILELNNPFPIY